MQTQKEGVRRRILNAALEQFYAHGYRGARITEIAGNAGVAVALIYNYFLNKAALFDAVVHQVYLALEELIDREIMIWNESGQETISDYDLNNFADQIFERCRPIAKNIYVLWYRADGSKHEQGRLSVEESLAKHIYKWGMRFTKKPIDGQFASMLSKIFLTGLVDSLVDERDDDACKQQFLRFWSVYRAGVATL